MENQERDYYHQDEEWGEDSEQEQEELRELRSSIHEEENKTGKTAGKIGRKNREGFYGGGIKCRATEKSRKKTEPRSGSRQTLRKPNKSKAQCPILKKGTQGH